jgi:hypothetical protein
MALMHTSVSTGAFGVLEYLLVLALLLVVALGLPIVAIVDLARTPDSAFQRGMARGGWVAIISILTVTTVVGGIAVVLWWLLVSRRGVSPHRA